MTCQLVRAAAAALLFTGLASPAVARAQTVYYLQADSTSSVGADGTCNLPSGNSTTNTNYQWKTTATTAAPNGSSTQIRTALTASGIWTSIARVYLSAAYGAATSITAPSGSVWLRATSSGDQFQFFLKDYDPNGAAGNGTTLSSSPAMTNINTGSAAQYAVSFAGTGTVSSGHRLMLEVMFNAGASGNTGRVYLNASTSNSSVTVTETTAAPPGAPGAPSYSGVTATSLTLSWSAGTNATSYNVQRSPDNANWTTLASGVTALSYGDSGLAGSTTYYYRVQAVNGGGITTGTASSVTTAAAPVNATTTVGLAATVNSCSSVTLVASYSGDDNQNDGLSALTRDGVSILGTCTVTADRVARTLTCNDATVPSATTTHAYAATFSDPDGVTGTNPVTATVSETACVAGQGTLTLGYHPNSAGWTGNGVSPAVTANPGQPGVVAGGFALTASGGSVLVDQLALANSGGSPRATSTDVESVSVYADTGPTPGSWDAGDALVATASWSASANGGAGAWIASGFTVPLGTTTYLVTLNAAYGATSGDQFALSLSTSSIIVDPKVSLAGSTSVAGGTVTIGAAPVGQKAGDSVTNSKLPMVLILNPGNGATVSLANPGNTVRVQVQVYDPSRTSITSVSLSRNGGADNFPYPLALNGNYGAVVGAYAGIYQADLPSSSLPAGSWTLQAKAVTNGGAFTAYSAPILVSVNAAGVGDGNLLVRNNSAQLCIDCHAVQSHTSQSTANKFTGLSKYGSWGVNCRDCHTPHKTHNAQLIRETIVPPPVAGAWQSAKTVRFWDRKTGDSGTSNAVSFVTSSTTLTGAATFGPCQACHTRTANNGGLARWRNTGNGDTHYVGSNTQQCTGCHSHATGFRGFESTGGEYCGKCHSALFWNMQAAGTPAPANPRLTKHTLGSAILGANDSWQNPTSSWTGTLATAVPIASRSCVGMCHGDHVHNDPAAWPSGTHNNNFYKTATTQASRALSRDANTANVTYGFATAASTGSLYVKSDYTKGQTTWGCIACHVNPVDASHPAISAPAYDASAHDVTTTPAGSTWEYVMHDDASPAYTSRFTRNCTKCHAGNQAEGQTVSQSGAVQGVHYSDNPSLLGGAVRPAGNAGSLVCYNCHGNGATGLNLSARDVASEVASTYAHPVNADAAHDTVAEAATTWGSGAYSGANRHVNCLDCHDPHRAGKVKHASATTTSNAIATTSPLYGASGVAVNFTGVGLFTAVPSANFSAVATAQYEYQVCFKCHTTWAWGGGAAPTALAAGGSGLQETDLSLEFNPGNRSGHPVVTGLSSYTGALSTGVHALAAGQLIAPWNANVGKQTMACSDCHGNDSASSTIVQGPHGSVGKFILKGPNAQWPTQADGTTAWTLGNYTTGQGASSGLFCLNCHPAMTTTNGAHTRGEHAQTPCFGCHIVIPHGGKLSRLIAQGGASAMPARYCYQGNKANCYIDKGFQRSSTYTSYNDSQCGSSVFGTGSGGCNTQHQSYTPTEQW